jgi:hypothetical protein
MISALQAIVITAYAQKLPNKQIVSLRAPVNIKIDGKTNEWNDLLQAYNHATEVFYTLSNDDNNLYLTIKASSYPVINKIINGGITFTVTGSDKKSKDGVSITYPVFEGNNKPSLNINKSLFEQSASHSVIPDSIVLVTNRKLEEKSKLIMLTGMKGVDTLISIYNEDHIKTAERFDNKMAYTYELSVALSQLGLSINDETKFNYHIVLNGESILPVKKSDNMKKLSPDVTNGLIFAKLVLENQTTAPTDFWGEYTLAKK